MSFGLRREEFPSMNIFFFLALKESRGLREFYFHGEGRQFVFRLQVGFARGAARFEEFRRTVHSFHHVCRCTLLEKLSIRVEIQSRAAECSE